MKTKPIKKIILYALPPFVGAIIGLLIILKPDGQSTGIISPTYEQADMTQTAGSQNNGQLLEDYLFSSQSLLAKAIEASKNKPQSQEEIVANNQKITQVINQAIGTINKAISFYPSDARAWAQRARIYQTIKIYLPESETAAIADWQNAIDLDPRNVDYCQAIAKLYVANSQKKEAIFYLQRASSSNPTDPNLLNQLAELQIEVGLLKQAKISYQQLLSILTSSEQRQKIEIELKGLNKLIAQSNYHDEAGLDAISKEPDEVILPDSPPLLQASDLLASGPIIAAPEDEKNTSQEETALSNALSGKAILKKGEVQIRICNTNLTTEKQVYLTPEDDNFNQVLNVKSKATDTEDENCPNFFIAAIQKPLNDDLAFRWLIIE